MVHPWHQVSPGQNPPTHINGIIEIPKGSRAKYEIDKETGLLMLDRVLYSSVYYPANYGFIPQSYGEDNDPLDILILSQVAIQPLCLVPARVIGVMRMIDRGEGDDKIIAVAEDDMSVAHIQDVSELADHFRLEIANFFEEYKKLENKTVVVEDFQPREVAHRIIEKSIIDYKKKFGGS
jgi:inorganic pyrophosphatase